MNERRERNRKRRGQGELWEVYGIQKEAPKVLRFLEEEVGGMWEQGGKTGENPSVIFRGRAGKRAVSLRLLRGQKLKVISPIEDLGLSSGAQTFFLGAISYRALLPTVRAILGLGDREVPLKHANILETVVLMHTCAALLEMEEWWKRQQYELRVVTSSPRRDVLGFGLESLMHPLDVKRQLTAEIQGVRDGGVVSMKLMESGEWMFDGKGVKLFAHTFGDLMDEMKGLQNDG